MKTSSKKIPDGRNLSEDEGNTIKKVLGVIVDAVVLLTGGKSSFGRKKNGE